MLLGFFDMLLGFFLSFFYGRHPLAHRKSRAACRQEKSSGNRDQGTRRRRLFAGRFSRPVASSQEDGIAAKPDGDAAQYWAILRAAEGRRQSGRETNQPGRGHHQLDDATRAPAP